MNEFKCLLNSLWLSNTKVAEIWGITSEATRAWARGRDQTPNHRMEQLREWERIWDDLVKQWAAAENIPAMTRKEDWKNQPVTIQLDLPHPYVWNSAVYFASRKTQQMV